jgi:hypothetical protein
MPFKDKSRYQSEEYKEYQRNYQRAWHQRHRAERLARLNQRKAVIRATNSEYIQDLKSQLCCVDCGQRHPATLHFHHLNPEDKAFNISHAITDGTSLDTIKKEIEKCIVLCANCHAIRHYNMRHEKQNSAGIAGELEEIDNLLAANPEEEEA